MEALPPVEELVAKLRGAGVVLPEGSVRVGAFGDCAELSEELLDLIRSGRKRAGASGRTRRTTKGSRARARSRSSWTR